MIKEGSESSRAAICSLRSPRQTRRTTSSSRIDSLPWSPILRFAKAALGPVRSSLRSHATACRNTSAGSSLATTMAAPHSSRRLRAAAWSLAVTARIRAPGAERRRPRSTDSTSVVSLPASTMTIVGCNRSTAASASAKLSVSPSTYKPARPPTSECKPARNNASPPQKRIVSPSADAGSAGSSSRAPSVMSSRRSRLITPWCRRSVLARCCGDISGYSGEPSKSFEFLGSKPL